MCRMTHETYTAFANYCYTIEAYGCLDRSREHLVLVTLGIPVCSTYTLLYRIIDSGVIL